MITDKDKIIEKIKKMLALSKSANEHEAALAASKAKEMLDNHNLEMAEIDEADIEVDKYSILDDRYNKNETEREEHREKGHNWPVWKRRLVGAIANNMDLGFYIGVTYKKSYTKMMLVGTKTDVQVAEYLLIYLVRQIKTLTRKYAKDSGINNRLEYYKNSYRLGIIRTLENRFIEMKHTSHIKMESTSTGKDLVVVKNGAIEKELSKLDFSKFRSRSSIINTDAYGKGQSDGKDISIRMGVNSANQTKEIA